MVSPAEQLIRDYLNRLSVAARGQLGPEDRRALIDRTREFIVRVSGQAGPPTAMEVGTLLAGLGDPSTLVEQERQRLTAERGELPEPPDIRNPLTKALRRDSGKPRGMSWHWPVPAGNRNDLQLALLDSAGASDAGANGSSGKVADGATSNGDPADSDQTRPHVPAQRRDRDWFFQSLGGHKASGPHGANSTRIEDDGEPAEQAAAAPTTVRPAWQLTTPPDPVLPRQVGRALTAAAAWYRRMPLEASAVVLLGLGGAIYPPVWLLGAIVALPSRVWDGRDKWLGLVLPILLTIVAAALGLTAAGHVALSQGLHEGWVFGVGGSRVAAVLSASYLCWRSVHGRRPPTLPPWNRPHRVS